MPQTGWGQDFEAPPTLSAAQILPDSIVKGPNHTVDNRVLNDGYMNHYTISSRFGQFEVVSTAKVRKRVDEIMALAAMEQVEGTDVFGDAVVKGGFDKSYRYRMNHSAVHQWNLVLALPIIPRWTTHPPSFAGMIA